MLLRVLLTVSLARGWRICFGDVFHCLCSRTNQKHGDLPLATKEVQSGKKHSFKTQQRPLVNHAAHLRLGKATLPTNYLELKNF